jgi:hypothetical protein
MDPTVGQVKAVKHKRRPTFQLRRSNPFDLFMLHVDVQSGAGCLHGERVKEYGNRFVTCPGILTELEIDDAGKLHSHATD